MGNNENRANAKTVDLNCDIGEGFGVYRIGQEEELLRFATSANIACGFHAGDPATMRRTVRLCLERGVAIGAHPGLPDRLGFGRREMAVTAEEAYEMTVYQIGALQAFVRAEGGVLRHVKPHGALYNMAARDAELAGAIAEAVRRVGEEFILIGLAGSRLTEAGLQAGLRVASEGFADRTYQPDGTLTPRSRPDAPLRSPDEAAAQAVRMVCRGEAAAGGGGFVRMKVDTICLHGDGEHAAASAERIRRELEAEGVSVRALAD